jgi:uncharacterized OsmC-like protein
MKPIATVTSVDAPALARRTVVRFEDNQGEVRGDNYEAHGGTGTGPDGFDLLAVAYGQCMLNTLMAILRREAISAHAASADVSLKTRHSASSAPRITDLHVHIRVDADLDDDQRADLFQRAADECGVHATLAPAVHLTGELTT